MSLFEFMLWGCVYFVVVCDLWVDGVSWFVVVRGALVCVGLSLLF